MSDFRDRVRKAVDQGLVDAHIWQEAAGPVMDRLAEILAEVEAPPAEAEGLRAALAELWRRQRGLAGSPGDELREQCPECYLLDAHEPDCPFAALAAYDARHPREVPGQPNSGSVQK